MSAVLQFSSTGWRGVLPASSSRNQPVPQPLVFLHSVFGLLRLSTLTRPQKRLASNTRGSHEAGLERSEQFGRSDSQIPGPAFVVPATGWCCRAFYSISRPGNLEALVSVVRNRSHRFDPCCSEQPPALEYPEGLNVLYR